jgi:2'-5' RNA ligase
MSRLFLAVPAKLTDFETLQKDFSDSLRGKWTKPENLHATLYFFGNMFEPDELIEKLSAIPMKVEPSPLLGAELFSHNRILSASSENPSLDALYETLTETLDLPSKRAYVTHVTLMRIKKILDYSTLERRIDAYRDRVIGTISEPVELLRSHTYPEGAEYELLRRFG